MLTNWNCQGEIHLVVGTGGITHHRVKSIIEAGALPVIITDTKSDIIDETVPQYEKTFEVSDLYRGREEVDGIVDKVFVNLSDSEQKLKQEIFQTCKRLRIPINTVDCPNLCTFSLLSTYKQKTLEIGVTTKGNGCKMASRIKREIVNNLPANIDDIISNISQLRAQIKQVDHINDKDPGEVDDVDYDKNLSLNKLVHEFDMTPEQLKFKRLNWLSQIIEYYPINKLGDINIDDLSSEFRTKHKLQKQTEAKDEQAEQDEQKEAEAENEAKEAKGQNKGTISLVGAGPGSLSLLTVGAIHEIMTANLILADKLVPQEVLDIIPKKIELFIARKFPGNAERAQEELLTIGLNSLLTGKKVVRLKQGDPYIFGRGGEEYNFFKNHGFNPKVVSGISSGLLAGTYSNIPLTHRDVSDQVLICTGTGKKGKLPNIPQYEPTRTTVFLMALHRITEFTKELITNYNWPSDLPVAIVERASCPDQRVIKTYLQYLPEIVEQFGSRPPGLLITGWACTVIDQFLGKYTVQEGLTPQENHPIMFPSDKFNFAI